MIVPQLGEYVKVILVPQPWEGSSEGAAELCAYVGHVGIAVEVLIAEQMCLVRFPSTRTENETGQRFIEFKALAHVSHPPRSIPVACLEG